MNSSTPDSTPNSTLNVDYRVVTAAEAARLQLANLGLPPARATMREAFSPETIAAEILRSTLWGLSRNVTGPAWSPVHVTKLLNRAGAIWWAGHWMALRVVENPKGSAEQKATDFLREVLDGLELIGDVAHLPRGMLLPAPTIAVHLSKLRRWLLVGGVPTIHLLPAVREALEYKGAARLLTDEAVALSLNVPILSSEDWLHVPPDDLQYWTRKTIDEEQIKPFSTREGEFRFYAPGNAGFFSSKDNFQHHRWHENVKMMPDGRCLFRQTTTFGAIRHGIAEIRAAKVVAAEYIDLRDGGVRRLMYGLDALAGCPTKCRRETANGEYIYVLSNEVPGPERRLLATVGQLLKNDGDAYYPRRWAVPRGYSAEVEKALARLYVTVETQQS